MIEWLPVAVEKGIEHRGLLRSAWRKIGDLLLGKRIDLGFTGMPGVGKSVLYDYLSGDAYKADYKLPMVSRKLEQGKLKVQESGNRLCFRIVPGQDSPPRNESLESLFGSKEPVDGVLHLVANGFIDLRSAEAKDAVIRQYGIEDIQKFRQIQIAEELRDLDETCDYIRRSIKHNRRPRWLIVAAAKVDLYQDDLAAAMRYYSPHGESEFVDRVKKLHSQAGSDNFSWEAAPVSAHLCDFHWSGSVVKSQLTHEMRDACLAQFLRILENHCES